MSEPHSKQRSARLALLTVVVLVFAAAVLLWRYTPLAQWADAERITAWMESLRQSRWAPVIVVGVFVVGGLIVFPLVLLIAATATVFDPLTAVIVALTGSLANAVTLYMLGRLVMRETVMNAFATAVGKLQQALSHTGIVAVAVVRMVPIAPFTLVNLAAGAIGVRLRDYVLGTLIGLLPGTLALTAFGRQLREIIEQPTLENVGLLVVVVAVWIALSLALQRWAARRSSRQRSG